MILIHPLYVAVVETIPNLPVSVPISDKESPALLEAHGFEVIVRNSCDFMRGYTCDVIRDGITGCGDSIGLAFFHWLSARADMIVKETAKRGGVR